MRTPQILDSPNQEQVAAVLDEGSVWLHRIDNLDDCCPCRGRELDRLKSAPRLERLQANETDLVLLDIKLKGSLSGIDVARIAVQRSVPHVFISGSGDLAMRRVVGATGLVTFLQKPFSPDRLAGLLKKITGYPGSARHGASAAN